MSRVLRAGLEEAAKSSAGHQRISISDLVKFPVPVPGFEEQREIASRVDRGLRMASAIQADIDATMVNLDRLDQSILAKAFRGELVPQDPADEPASVLLDRIHGRLPMPPTTAVPWAKASRFVLMLLRKWKNRAAADLVNRGLMLMLNDDLRGRLLRPNRIPAGSPPAVPTHWFPRLVEEMAGYGYPKPPIRRGETQV